MAKKRANGEGSIRKRKDGRWEGRYTAGHTPEGKAIYRNVLGKTQAEVVEKLRRAIEETKGLDVAKAGQYTLGQWMWVWYENYATIKVRPSSHATYRGIIYGSGRKTTPEPGSSGVVLCCPFWRKNSTVYTTETAE